MHKEYNNSLARIRKILLLAKNRGRRRYPWLWPREHRVPPKSQIHWPQKSQSKGHRASADFSSGLKGSLHLPSPVLQRHLKLLFLLHLITVAVAVCLQKPQNKYVLRVHGVLVWFGFCSVGLVFKGFFCVCRAFMVWVFFMSSFSKNSSLI